MSAFDAYKEYVALKNHFTKPNYDYIKYNGKTGLKLESFNKRKDKLFFEKLAKKDNVHEFLVANFSDNPKLWIRDLAYSEAAENTYSSWKKKNQSLTYNFKNEVEEHLTVPFNFNFAVKQGEHPYLMRSYLSGRLSLETFCILLDLTKAIPSWDSKMEYDPIWQDLSLKVKKYTPFIKYDKDKFRKIILDFYGD